MLRLSQVGRSFGYGPGQVVALTDVSFEVPQGDMVSIMGPSGSGKSTLLNILGLLDTPTHGTYEIDDVQVTSLSQAQVNRVRGLQIGFVFQAFHLLDHRTALENVSLGLAYAGVSRRERSAAAQAALARVGLSHRASALPATMSGGERQRVAVARAVAAKPAVLLCDEPTGNLDSGNARTVMRIIHELNDEGQTVVIVTHDSAVAQACRREIRLRDGSVESDSRKVVPA